MSDTTNTETNNEQLTDVQLRQKVLDLEKMNADLTTNFNTVNDKLTAVNEEKTNLLSEIKSLKETNYDLFVQVSNPVGATNSNHQTPLTVPQVEDKPKTKSINEIASLLGGN